MTRCLFLVFVLLGVSLGRPEFKPYLGLSNLNTPSSVSEDGRRASHSVLYTHPSGKHFKASYVAELADGINVLSLDRDESVEEVRCNHGVGSVTITFMDEDASQEFQSQFDDDSKFVLAGGREWGCRNLAGKRETILLLVTGIAASQGSHLRLNTLPLRYEEVFANLDLNLEVSAFPRTTEYDASMRQQEAKNARNADIAANTRREARRLHVSHSHDVKLAQTSSWWPWDGIVKFAKKVAHAVVDLARRIANKFAGLIDGIVEFMKDTLQLLITGALNLENNKDLVDIGWNYNKANRSALKPSWPMGSSDVGFVTCENCYFHFGVTAHLVIKIAKFQLNEFEASVTGDLEAHLRMIAQTHITDSWQDQVWDGMGLREVFMDIFGIPLTYHPEFPTDVGFDLNVTPSAALEYTVTGNSTYGVKFADNKWGTIHENNWETFHNFTGTGIQETIDMYVWVEPKLFLEVDHIGGPELGVKVGVDLTLIPAITVGMCEADPSKVGSSVSAEATLKSSVEIGARLQIEFGIGHTKPYETPPLVVPLPPIPLWSGCMDIGSFSSIDDAVYDFDNVTLSETPPRLTAGAAWSVRPGTTFAGVLMAKREAQGCANLPDVQTSLQLITPYDPSWSNASAVANQLQFLHTRTGLWKKEQMGNASETFSGLQCEDFSGATHCFDAHCEKQQCSSDQMAASIVPQAVLSRSDDKDEERCGNKPITETCPLPSGNVGKCRQIVYNPKPDYSQKDHPLEPTSSGFCCHECGPPSWQSSWNDRNLLNMQCDEAKEHWHMRVKVNMTLAQCEELAVQMLCGMIQFDFATGGRDMPGTCYYYPGSSAEDLMEICGDTMVHSHTIDMHVYVGEAGDCSDGDPYWCDNECQNCRGSVDEAHGGGPANYSPTCPNMKPGTCQKTGVKKRAPFKRQPFVSQQHMSHVTKEGHLMPQREQQCTEQMHNDTNSVCFVQLDSLGPNQSSYQSAEHLPAIKVKIFGDGVLAAPVDGSCYDPTILPRRPHDSLNGWTLHGACGPQCDGAVDPKQQPGQAGCVMIGGVHKTGFFDCVRIADRAVPKAECRKSLMQQNDYNQQDIADCEHLIEQSQAMTSNVLDTVVGYDNSPPLEPYCRLWQCAQLSSGTIPAQDGDQAWLIAYKKKDLTSIVV